MNSSFDWALEYPEVYKICSLFQLNELHNPVKVRYKPLSYYIQQGPQCGLVALSMCVGDPNMDKTVKELYNLSLQLGYTFNGEIFSAEYMLNLAKLYMGHQIDAKIYDGYLESEEVKTFLMDGGLILVPYDSDLINQPALFNGHKAHWAVISGAIETEDSFYVIARHGKAFNVGIWSLESLAKSNGQLNEFSPDRKSSHLEYKLPEGGINGPHGLKLKSVFLMFQNKRDS